MNEHKQIRHEQEPDERHRQTVDVTIKWIDGDPSSELEALAQEMFEKAVAYVQDIFGEGYPIPSLYHLHMISGKSHGNGGIIMYLSRELLLDALQGDATRRETEQSLIVHEFVHNVQEYEDLPMLAELLYLLEHGQETYIKEKICVAYLKDKFEKQYRDGLSKIAGWMGYSDGASFLNELTPASADRMKMIFQREIKKIMDELKTRRLEARRRRGT